MRTLSFGILGTAFLISTLFVAACGSDDDTAPTDVDGGTGGGGGEPDAEAPNPDSGTGGSPADAAPPPMDAAGDAPAPMLLSGPPDYTDTATWLCYPGAANNYCLEDLDATSLAVDGTGTPEPHTVATDPPFDCFYVYPTLSTDGAYNSDLNPDVEISVVQQQAARLNGLCEVYAPIYRQVTLAALFDPNVMPVGSPEEARELAYADVKAAWDHYMSERNQGRGFVLIGHSQGSGHLNRLMREEIDGDDTLRGQLISAYLLGSAVSVPEGEDVGGDFMNIPACRDPAQTGCVVTYMSFVDTEPPVAASFFGRPRNGMGVALCTNPAALAGGSAVLSPYFLSDGAIVPLDGLDPVTTPFVTFPDYLEAECVVRDGFSILEFTVLPDGPRPDNIGGNITPEWGKHLIDANIAMGDIVTLVGTQSAAYLTP